ncbi:tail fiber protein [Caulobacter phage Lullwater]|uniref:Tail fiber protein n=1 Tax=Caulobacter phage Lullwater TaxID=2024607 RepID=A0A291LB42_9CAUD|nr:tail fiber protein [Caulobacter phage Lullwater]ATI16347.1 tail fiber protein [Caulobacter phage Lullwater]
MSSDPILDSGVSYSINTFPGDGSTTSFNINFSGGYIQQSHVKGYIDNMDDTRTDVIVTFTGPSTVSTSAPAPVGKNMVIWRDTPKSSPMVDFTDGSIVNEANLDKIARQAVFVSAEMVDRFATVADLGDDAITIANLATAKAEEAITKANALTGGDFSQFVLLSNLTWNNVSGKPTTFAPSAHTHAQSEITGLATALTTLQTNINAKFADGDSLKVDRQAIVTPAITAGVLTLDLSQGSVFEVDWNANITSIVVSNCPSGSVSWTVILKGNGTSYTLTWNTGIFKPASGTYPTLVSGSGSWNFLTMMTTNAAARVNLFYAGAT